jgi:hypothetical protein
MTQRLRDDLGVDVLREQQSISPSLAFLSAVRSHWPSIYPHALTLGLSRSTLFHSNGAASGNHSKHDAHSNSVMFHRVRVEPRDAVRYVSSAYDLVVGYMGRKGEMDRASKGGEYRDRFPSGQSRTHERFARSVLDGLSAHIAVLDGSGASSPSTRRGGSSPGPTGPIPGRSRRGRTTWRRAALRRVRAPRGPPRSRRRCGTCCAAGGGPSNWSTRATIARCGAGSSGG